MAQSFRTAISFDGLASASSQALAIKVDGDSQNRVLVDAGGKITWGAGGSSAGDTTLYRSAANTLKTDDAFTAASLAVTGEFTLPTSDGSNNQVLVTNGSGTVSWANQSGGGGSPGGSDTQFQYNNGGSFGGATNLIYDDANDRVGIGTTAPERTLHVNSGTVNTAALFESTDANVRIYMQDSGSTDAEQVGLLGISDDLRLVAGGGARMTIDSSGNVGIGTTSPTGMLHVSGSDPKIWLTDTDTNADSYVSASSSVGSLILSADENNEVGSSQIALKVDGSDKMVIQSTGNVGIGTTAPDNKLHVQLAGTSKAPASVPATHMIIADAGDTNDAGVAVYSSTTGKGYLRFGDSDASAQGGFSYDHDTNALKIRTAGSDHITIDSSGNMTINGDIDGEQDFTVGNGEGEFVLFQGSSNQVFVQSNGTYRAYWNTDGHYLPYADSSYDLGGSSIRWRDAYTDSLTTGTATVTLINHSGVSSRDKIRVWNSGTYAIGMQSGFTFGPLNDYAMTFQMSNSSSRGFWWGDTGHGQDQGAMALSTIGELYVPTSIKVGYGETNTSDTYSYDLQVSTDIRLNNLTLTSVDADGSMRVQGSGGYIDIGPKNTSYCHIYTDRGSFYFNKETLYANSTSNKIWHRGDLRGGAVSVALDGSGYGTISHGLGTTPDFAFVGARTRLSSDNDNQLAFPVTAASSSTITFRAYEINGNGNSNYTSSTIYSATVYVYWVAGDM
jgi:hypothetical protein